jgi:predicted nucleotidyltransferase
MKDPRKLAEKSVQELRQATGDRLRSAMLFGSAARNEWVDGVSDVNLLVLVDRIDAALLAGAASAARQAVESGVTPLLMELDEWAAAADVFAIEIADMQQAGLPLHGDSPVAGVAVQPARLRLQAERELRAKLLHLHGGMLLAAGDRKRLGQLFLVALPSFATYLRAALRLAGREVPMDTRETIDAGCSLAGADPRPLLAVHAARVAGGGLELDLADPLADDFNEAAKRLATWIDEFGR